MEWLDEHRPDLVPRYRELYRRGAYAPQRERRRLAELIQGPDLAPSERGRGAFLHGARAAASGAPAAAGVTIRVVRLVVNRIRPAVLRNRPDPHNALGAMPRQFRPRRDLNLDRMFETRSDAWEKVGLSFEVNKREVRRAQWQAIVFLLAVIAVDIASHILLNNSHDRSGLHDGPRCGTVSLLSQLGSRRPADAGADHRRAARGRPRLGPGARDRPVRRPDVPAPDGPRHRRHVRVPHPPDHDADRADPGAAASQARRCNRWPSAAPSPPSSSVSPPSRRWAT